MGITLDRDELLLTDPNQYNTVEHNVANKSSIQAAIEFCDFVTNQGGIYAVEKLQKIYKEYKYDEKQEAIIAYEHNMQYWNAPFPYKLAHIIEAGQTKIDQILATLETQQNKLDSEYTKALEQHSNINKSFNAYMANKKAKDKELGYQDTRYNLKYYKEKFTDDLIEIINSYTGKRQSIDEKIESTKKLSGLDIGSIFTNAVKCFTRRKAALLSLFESVNTTLNSNAISKPPVTLKVFRLNDKDEVVSNSMTLTHLAQGVYYYLSNKNESAKLCMIFEPLTSQPAAFVFDTVWENNLEYVMKRLDNIKDKINNSDFWIGKNGVDYILNLIENKQWINISQIEFLRFTQNNAMAQEAAQLRQSIRQKQADKENAEQLEKAVKQAEKQAERQANNMAELTKINKAIAELETHLTSAKTLTEDSKLLELTIKNESLSLFNDTADEHSKAESCLVEQLFNHYKVKLPLKVLGWMRKNLHSVTFEDGKFASGKVYTQSSTIFNYMHQLVDSAKESLSKRLNVA